jgi:plastocyanin
MHRTAIASILVPALTCIVQLAAAAPVKGIVKLPAGTTPAALTKAAGYWLLPNDVLNVLPPLVDVRASMVVSIEGTGLTPTAVTKPVFRLEDMRIAPPVLAVRKNTKVTFENKDTVLHLLEAAAEGTSFPATRIAPGTSVAHTFDKEGAYQLRCSEYPHMTGAVVVLDAPLFTSPDNSGAFSFPEVRNGAYTLRVWYQGEWIHSQPLTVQFPRTTVEVQLQQLRLSEKK